MLLFVYFGYSHTFICLGNYCLFFITWMVGLQWYWTKTYCYSTSNHVMVRRLTSSKMRAAQLKEVFGTKSFNRWGGKKKILKLSFDAYLLFVSSAASPSSDGKMYCCSLNSLIIDGLRYRQQTYKQTNKKNF